MSTNGTIPLTALPNPFTPMAFLPPDLAFQVTISTYILIGSCGIMVWDILNNLPSDIRLLKDYRITYPTIIYFISRLGALGYVLASTIFETAPTGNCRVFEKVVDWLFPVAVPFTSLLFFFRVRAIFDNNKFVVAFFGFMWLAVLAGCLTVTQGVTGANIGTTNYCINASLEGYVSAAAIIPLVNDTLVFIAISWRLLMNSHLENNLKDGVRTLVFGVHMPAFSKSLLQDGQAYYLTTVTTSLMTVIMLYIKAVPVSYQTMFTVPNIMLMNIMACRVFRNTKFGIFRENTYSSARYKSTVKDDKFAVPLSLTSGGTAGRNGRQVRGQVSETTLGHDAVMKTVEYDSDSGKYGEYPPVTVGDHNV